MALRHFIVLGFESNSNSAHGEQVHIGSDRGDAIEVSNDPSGGYARKELYELAIPHICRHFPVASTEKPEPAAEPDPVEDEVEETEADPVDESEADSDLPEMTSSARELAEANGLTAEQIAEITPTGTTGKILKEDVEDYLDPPDEGDE